MRASLGSMLLLAAIAVVLARPDGDVAASDVDVEPAVGSGGRRQRVRRQVTPLPELETAAGFAKFYSQAPLGIVLYKSTDCLRCDDAQHAMEQAIAAAAAQRVGGAAAAQKIPLAAVVLDTTDLYSDQLFREAPHHSPPTPSYGVVRYGTVVRKRWKNTNDFSPEYVQAQLFTLLQEPYATLESVEEVRAFHPMLAATPLRPAAAAQRHSSSSARGQSSEGSVAADGAAVDPVPEDLPEHLRGGARACNGTIVVLALFPVPHHELGAFNEAADHLKDAPNVRIVLSKAPAVARYFGRPADSASVGVFYEGFPQYPPQWAELPHDASAGGSCAAGDDGSESDCGKSAQRQVGVIEFLLGAARPPVEGFAVDLDEARMHRPAPFHGYLPGPIGDVQVMLYTTRELVETVVHGTALEIRRRLGLGGLVTVMHTLGEQDDTLTPFKIPFRDVKAANRRGKMAWGVKMVNRDSVVYAPPPPYEFAGVDKLMRFVDDVRAGRVKETVWSQPPATDAASGAVLAPRRGSVFRAVGSNLVEVLRQDPDRDTLLLLLGRECDDECRRTKLIFDDLADAFRDDPTVQLVAIDADNNDVPRGYSRSAYPEIAMIFPWAWETPEWYAMDLTFDDLWTFTARRRRTWDGEGKPPDRVSGRSSNFDDEDEIDPAWVPPSGGLSDYQGPDKRGPGGVHQPRPLKKRNKRANRNIAIPPPTPM